MKLTIAMKACIYIFVSSNVFLGNTYGIFYKTDIVCICVHIIFILYSVKYNAILYVSNRQYLAIAFLPRLFKYILSEITVSGQIHRRSASESCLHLRCRSTKYFELYSRVLVFANYVRTRNIDMLLI